MRNPGDMSIWEYLRHGRRSQLKPSSPPMIPHEKSREPLAWLPTDPSLCGHVDVDGTAKERLALIEHTRGVWSDYGEKDPFFSVLTNDEFKMDSITVEGEKKFYQSGAEDAEEFFKACARNRISPPWNGTIVDFGCGLGRVGEHLARKFETYIGVDISPSHLARAKARFASVGSRDAHFMLLPDYLDHPMPADAYFSIIVLQHNPPPIIAMMLDKLCGMLRPGGIGYFQVPIALFDYEFHLTDYLQAPPSHGAMEMHPLPQHEVFRILHRNACYPLEVRQEDKVGPIGISMTFLVRKTGQDMAVSQ